MKFFTALAVFAVLAQHTATAASSLRGLEDVATDSSLVDTTAPTTAPEAPTASPTTGTIDTLAPTTAPTLHIPSHATAPTIATEATEGGGDISLEDLKSVALSKEQLSMLEQVYEAFGPENCGEIMEGRPDGLPDFVRAFKCERNATHFYTGREYTTRKAVMQTAGNVELSIEIVDTKFYPAETIHQSLCNRDPAIGFSFEECETRLNEFFSVEFVPTASPTSYPTYSPAVLSDEQIVLREAIIDFFGQDDCETHELPPIGQITFCGEQGHGGVFKALNDTTAFIIVNLSGEENPTNADANLLLQAICNDDPESISDMITDFPGEFLTFDGCAETLDAFFAGERIVAPPTIDTHAPTTDTDASTEPTATEAPTSEP